jgi:hypothetical protein
LGGVYHWKEKKPTDEVQSGSKQIFNSIKTWELANLAKTKLNEWSLTPWKHDGDAKQSTPNLGSKERRANHVP